MNAFLRIERMVVTRGSAVLYDERFHAGVNIIHGNNGSGKSTLADFIFFGLGGDLRDWRKSAERAESVTLEVATPSGNLTLRRHPSTDSQRPMYIYFGSMNDALSASRDRWQELTYRRPDRGYSFSQVLFKAIGLPEAVSDGASNITMHQVLRLLYVDQLTPVQRIFRVEGFDTWQTRQAVGDMLAGIGGYDLYDRQIEWRETKRSYDTAAADYRSLVAVASGYGENILAEHINSELIRLSEERNALSQQVVSLTQDADAEVEQNQVQRLRSEAQKQLTRAAKAVRKLEEEVQILDYEIEDAELFIEHLQQSLVDFDKAKLAFFALGRVEFEYCPSCFAPVTEKQAGHCLLCDVPRAPEEEEARTLAVRLDLQMQLEESESLQTDRKADLVAKKSFLRVARAAQRQAGASVYLSGAGAVTGREAAVAEFSRKIGFIDSELQSLQKRLELAKRVQAASDAKEDLNSKLTRLAAQITAIERTQNARKQTAYSLVSREAKKLLDQDLAGHSDFGEVLNVDFSFADDWVAINGEKSRARSASGMVILKNSFAAAMFKSSLVDSSFNLPRWILFDNIEDKGMVMERSHNFQRLLVAASKASRVPHQIIFTTSMLAPELDIPELVIGPKYTESYKSLR